MSPIQAIPLNEKTRPLVAIAGAVLILLGIHQVWIGWKIRPLTVVRQKSAMPISNPGGERGRLGRHDRSDGSQPCGSKLHLLQRLVIVPRHRH